MHSDAQMCEAGPTEPVNAVAGHDEADVMDSRAGVLPPSQLLAKPRADGPTPGDEGSGERCSSWHSNLGVRPLGN